MPLLRLIRHTLLLCLASSGVLFSLAQELDVRSLADTRSALSFNADFIALNGIDTIRVIEEIKRSNEPIRRTGKEVLFRFNDRGQLITKATFRSMNGRIDTILERYGLGEEAQLKKYIRNDQRGRYEERFQYEGDSVRIRRFRGEEGTEKVTFINAELRVKMSTDSGYEITTFNENGLPYLRERYAFKEGYLQSVERTYVVSRRTERIEYQYNEKGRLQWCAAEAADGKREWSFTYTDDGLLRELLERFEGVTVNRSEYLRATDGLLSAIVSFDPKTEHIRIERFAYQTEQ